MQYTATEYEAAIAQLRVAKEQINKALGSVNDGDSRRYSREAADIFISINEVEDQLIEDWAASTTNVEDENYHNQYTLNELENM